MKYLFAVMAVGLLMGLNSCGYMERDFLGKWQVYDLELESEWRGNIVDDDMRDYYKMVYYEFLPEGKMVYYDPSGEAEGTWKLTDGENLEMKYKMVNVYQYKRENLKCKILSCTAGKMALQMKFQENETWIFYLREAKK